MIKHTPAVVRDFVVDNADLLLSDEAVERNGFTEAQREAVYLLISDAIVTWETLQEKNLPIRK